MCMRARVGNKYLVNGGAELETRLNGAGALHLRERGGGNLHLEVHVQVVAAHLVALHKRDALRTTSLQP